MMESLNACERRSQLFTCALLGGEYLLLIYSGSGGDTEADALDIPTTHSQMERAAVGLVQIVDVAHRRVAVFFSCRQHRIQLIVP